jgi:hypothetical protein
LSTVEKHHSQSQGFCNLLATSLIAVLVALGTVTSASARDASQYYSAGLQSLVNSAHQKYQGLKDGANANYIPILDTVPSDLFGVVIVTNNGQVFSAELGASIYLGD